MYTDHFHLDAKPFDLSPGSHFLWLGEKHKEALATLKYGILEDLGFLLLTGDVGVGKTALIHRLIGTLDSSTIVAHITDPGLGTLDFFKLLASEFNITKAFNSKGEFLIELEKFLYKAYSEHKKVLLIVDEAQRLNSKLLDQIRVLSNIERSDRKLINIFFVGQPEFKNILMANSNRAIRQRIAINYHIQPLTESETGQYIEHRLKMAGATRKIFKPNATIEIFRVAGGFPRAINILCDHALLTGYASGLQTIDADVIKECEQELKIRAGFDFNTTAVQTPADPVRSETPAPFPRQSRSRRHPLLIGLGFVLIAFLSYYLLGPIPPWTNQPINQQKRTESSPPQTHMVIKKEIENESTQATSEPDVALAQTYPEKSALDKMAPKAETTAADRQPAIFTEKASPAPDQLPVKRMADRDVDVPVKPENNLALLPAASDTDPGRPTGEATPAPDQSFPDNEAESDASGPAKAEKTVTLLSAASDAAPGKQADKPTTKAEIKKQAVSIPEDRATVVDRQPPISKDQATPATDRTSPNDEAESDVSAPVKAEKTVVSAAVIPGTRPSPQPAKGAAVSDAAGRPATNALQSTNTQDATAAEPKSKATVPSASPTQAGSSKTATANNQNQSKQAAVPKKVSSDKRAESPIAAKAETQSQPAKATMGSAAPPDQQSGINGLENRVRSFLQNYCSTYASKDLDAFSDLFIADARENGEPFIRLLPKYQRNFSVIETIQYRIELQQFSYDEAKEIVTIDGLFFLKWLPPDKKWRENTGSISMRLQEKGPSFLVQRLDYQGARSKQE